MLNIEQDDFVAQDLSEKISCNHVAWKKIEILFIPVDMRTSSSYTENHDFVA
jgi:hypothetical protein